MAPVGAALATPFPMTTRPASHFLEIYLAIYRLAVVVTWETSLGDILAFARRGKVEITRERWGKDFSEYADDPHCNGLTMLLGDDNADVLVWLRHRPKKASEYGVLYHELFHAVQQIVKSRNLGDEIESPAFLFEYLANQCNKVLWAQSRRR